MKDVIYQDKPTENTYDSWLHFYLQHGACVELAEKWTNERIKKEIKDSDIK